MKFLHKPANVFGFSLGALVQANGLMGLIVLTILLDRGIITTNVFSALVLMGVLTTMLAMPLTRLALHYEHRKGTARSAGRPIVPAVMHGSCGSGGGSNEVARNISGVAEAAQSTLTGTAGSKKAAQQLTEMSTQLRGLVEQFKMEAQAKDLVDVRAENVIVA